MTKKTAVPAKTGKKGNRRGDGEKIYMSGEPSEEESKNPNIVRINMKQFDEESIKSTSFFTDIGAEEIL